MNKNEFYLWAISIISVLLVLVGVVNGAYDTAHDNSLLRQKKVAACESINNGTERTLCLKDI